MLSTALLTPFFPSLEWIDILIVLAGWTIGNTIFNNFEKHLPLKRRLAKLLALLVILTIIGLLFGRYLFYGLIALMAVGQTILHAWYFPKHGVNGFTAEPYAKYLELIERMKGSKK